MYHALKNTFYILLLTLLSLQNYGAVLGGEPCSGATTGLQRAECYYHIAASFQQAGQYESAIINYKEVLAQLNEEQSAFKDTYQKLSECFEQSKQLQKAITYQQLYVDQLKSKNTYSSNFLAAKERLADLKAQNNELNEAQQELEEVEYLNLKQKNNAGVIRSRAKIEQIKKKKKSQNGFLSSSRTANNTEELNTRSQQENDSYKWEEDIEEETEEAIEFEFEDNTNIPSEELIQTYDAVGDYYESVGNKDKVIEYKKKAVEEAKTSGNKEVVVEKRRELANSLFSANKTEEAISELEQTVVLADSIGDFKIKSEALKELSTVYSAAGSTDKAEETYSRYAATLDTSYKKNLEKIENSTRLLSRQKGYELDAKDAQISQQQYVLQAKELRYQKWISAIALTALLFTIVGAFLIFRNAKQKRKANQLLALKSLRGQMNPHFIFNALNSVNSFISKNDERSANKFLSEFSKLMRMVMEYSQQDFIVLSQEINILQLYLKLEHHRFQDKFSYTFEVEENLDIDNFLIPPMLIQPYIENAVWHGLRYKEEFGQLEVKIQAVDSGIKVIVADDGIGRLKSQEIKTKNQKEQNSTGMRNIETRLKILNEIFKTNLSVEVVDAYSDGRGTIVTIQIPKKHKV